MTYLTRLEVITSTIIRRVLAIHISRRVCAVEALIRVYSQL